MTSQHRSLHWKLLAVIILVLAQAGFGIAVNIYVTVVIVAGVAVQAVRAAPRSVGGWSVLGGLLVIGAGFNGAGFLDFGNAISSLIMALLAFAAIGCDGTGLALLAGTRPA